MITIRFTATILLLLPVYYGLGQNGKGIENELLKQYRIISRWSGSPDSAYAPHDYDSLDVANRSFLQLLAHCTSTEPSTISYPFTALQKEGVIIAGSANGKLRIYSWDTRTGGSLHLFGTVVQYRSGEKTYSQILHYTSDQEDPGYYYPRIYTIRRRGIPYYLAQYDGIYSSKDCYEGIRVFAIDQHTLVDTVQLIRTTSGLHNSLGFTYDFFSVYQRKERPMHLITYDPQTQTLNIPIVLPKGKVTEGCIRYRFTGTYFEKVK